MYCYGIIIDKYPFSVQYPYKSITMKTILGHLLPANTEGNQKRFSPVEKLPLAFCQNNFKLNSIQEFR
jgi:hypothetical protein